jgi:hypothetical protein
MSDRQTADRKTRVQTKFDERQLAEIDAYRRKQPDPPSRAEAIRRLCSLAIKGKSAA